MRHGRRRGNSERPASQGIESVGVKVEDFKNVDGLVEQLNTYNVGHKYKCLREELKD
jgi:hypothetical protein